MRSTLFYIPNDTIAGLPILGFGWLLIAWLVLCAGLLIWLVRQQGWNKDTASYLPFLLAVAGVIAFLLPGLVEYGELPSDGGPREMLGIPVRGFGVMMMLAMVASVGLAMYRAHQMGLDPEVISTLSMCMIATGLLGARLFYIYQYWDQFFKPEIPLRDSLLSLVNVTKGGLVVYGSVIAGVPAGVYYLVRRGLPVLAVGDIIAPSMVVGLAIGRIGCFLNGCCFGSACDWPIAMSFPKGSPPYERQQETGELYGFKLKVGTGKDEVVIDQIKSGSAAEHSGAKPGSVITHINGGKVATLEDAKKRLLLAGSIIELKTADGQTFLLQQQVWPGRSLPIHPTQLYAALDAALLALVLWLFYPYRRRDGEVFALLVTIHPISRFVIEAIRSDESGQWGTYFTISQWISGAILIAACGFWIYLERLPRGSVLPVMDKG